MSGSFNEAYILAVTQAISYYRGARAFTSALSGPGPACPFLVLPTGRHWRCLLATASRPSTSEMTV